MDEVRVRRLCAGDAHDAGDLPPMVGRMQEDVRQDIVHRVRPGLTFGVLVGNLFCKAGKRKLGEIIIP